MHTAAEIEGRILVDLKVIIEAHVEAVVYLRAQAAMFCELHYKNGFVFVGKAVCLKGSNLPAAKERARHDALKKAIMAEQYNLCERLYQDGGNEQKRLDDKNATK